MRATRLVAVILSLLLGSTAVLAGPRHAAAGPERPVSGLVVAVDDVDRTIYVGPVLLRVPSRVFDLERLSTGSFAVVHFERTADGLVATRIRVDSEPR